MSTWRYINYANRGWDDASLHVHKLCKWGYINYAKGDGTTQVYMYINYANGDHINYAKGDGTTLSLHVHKLCKWGYINYAKVWDGTDASLHVTLNWHGLNRDERTSLLCNFTRDKYCAESLQRWQMCTQTSCTTPLTIRS